MFSEEHTPKQAKLGTRLCPFSHSYATGYGSHAPPFFGPFTPVFVGYVQKSGLCQLIKAFCSPFCQITVMCHFRLAVHGACLVVLDVGNTSGILLLCFILYGRGNAVAEARFGR